MRRQRKASATNDATKRLEKVSAHLCELSPKDDFLWIKKIRHGHHCNAQLFTNFFNQTHAGMIAIIHSINKIGYPRIFAQNWSKTSKDCGGRHILLQTASIRAFARNSHGINTDMPQLARSPMPPSNQCPIQHISHGDTVRKMDVGHGGRRLVHSLILNKCGQSRRILDANRSIQ